MPDIKAKKDFDKKLSIEESKYASIAMQKLEEELKQIYEENKRIEEDKAARYTTTTTTTTSNNNTNTTTTTTVQTSC